MKGQLKGTAHPTRLMKAEIKRKGELHSYTLKVEVRGLSINYLEYLLKRLGFNIIELIETTKK